MTLLFKFLGWRGIVGIGVALVLSVLLAIQWGEARHWRKQSDQYQQLYDAEKSAFDKTVSDYRAAAAKQKVDDDAKNTRTITQQQAANKEQSDELQARLAAATAERDRLRANAKAAANSGGKPGTPVPGISTPIAGPDEAASKDGLSADDQYLCTVQSIQLDELEKWIERQHAIDPNAEPSQL